VSKSDIPRDGEAGFTLIEVMLAGTLSMLLLLPAYALLAATYRFADAVESRFHQSEEARQVLSLLGDGSASFGMVEGLRSRAALPSGWVLRQAGQFVMTDGSRPQLAGDAVPSLVVQCTGAATPVPDCKSTEALTVQGWMGSDPVLAMASAQVAGVSIAITDPYRAQRVAKYPGSVTEAYRSMFGLNVEANP